MFKHMSVAECRTQICLHGIKGLVLKAILLSRLFKMHTFGLQIEVVMCQKVLLTSLIMEKYDRQRSGAYVVT